MAIIEGTTDSAVTSMSPRDIPTASQFGEFAKSYAPSVPPEIMNALLNIESQAGTAKGSQIHRDVGNGRTVFGPMQIQSHAGSYRADDSVTSLAQAYFPSKQLKAQFNPDSLVHATVAGMAFAEAAWKKAKGSIEEFAGIYHGKGKSNNGETHITYAAKLRDPVNQGSSEHSINFFAGRGVTERQVAAIANNPEKLQQENIAAANARSLGEQQKSTLQASTDSTIAAILGLGKAGLEVLKAEYGEATDKAVAAKDFMTRALGFDVTSNNTNLTAAGKALDKNLGDILNLKDGLDKARSNPIYAILDGMSGGKTSKVFTDAISTRQAEATNISNAVNQIQQMATNASAIGMKTISSMSDAEFRAKAGAQEAKTNYDIAVARGNSDVKSVAIDMKIEKTITGIENATVRLGLAQERAALQQTGIELNNQIKAFKLAADQANAPADSEKKAEQLEALRLGNEKKANDLMEKAKLVKAFETASKALNLDSAIVAKQFAAKDPLTMEIVKGANQDTKSLGVLKLLDSKGKLEEADKIAVRRAVGNSGWADERSNIVIAGSAKLVDAEFAKLKAPKTQAESDARNILRENAKAFEVSKLQDNIVNVSGLRDSEKNPYAANHALVLSSNQTLLAPVVSKPEAAELYKAVASSQLYKSLQTEMQTGKKIDSDLTVLNAAVKLLKTKSGSEYSTQQAGEDISNYFKFAMLTNNAEKNYSAAGFNNQDTYGVNLTGLAAASGIDNAMDFVRAAIPGYPIPDSNLGIARNDKQAVRAQLTDLANPQAATRAILTLAIQQRN